MILTDHELRRSLQEGDFTIEPFPPDECIQPASIDLHLGRSILVYVGGKLLEIGGPVRPGDLIEEEIPANGYALEPGGFLLASTLEKVRVGTSLVMRVEGKSSIGRLGLLVHATAGFIDPGFVGRITLELFNANAVPIVLRPGVRICQVCLTPLFGNVDRPYGSPGLGSHYQGQDGPTAPR
jgi:dCTP deaminase